MTEHRKIAAAGIAVLVERWPQCFRFLERARQPLKIGIHEEVLAAGVLPEKHVPIVLRWYVGSLSYRRKCVEGATRIGLDGEPAGTVSAKHAAEQAKQVKQIVEKKAEAATAAKRPAKAPPAAAPVAVAVLAAVEPLAAVATPAAPPAVRPGRRPLLTLPAMRKSA